MVVAYPHFFNWKYEICQVLKYFSPLKGKSLLFSLMLLHLLDNVGTKISAFAVAKSNKIVFKEAECQGVAAKGHFPGWAYLFFCFSPFFLHGVEGSTQSTILLC